MAVLLIPTNNEVPAFRFSVGLENEVYRFVFRYNSRIDNWVFDVFTSNNQPVQTGNPYISDFILLKQNVRVIKYPGQLAALNLTGSGLNAERFNIGTDVKLFYSESEE